MNCLIAITPNGAKIYVANNGNGSNTVSVIATATDSVTTTIPVGKNPFSIAITPNGDKVYAISGTGTVSVIATATDTVTATIPVGAVPFGVALTPDGTKAYVANQGDNTVSEIDTATNTVTTTIPVGHGPYAFGKFIGGPASGSPPVAVDETKTTPANTPVLIDLSQGATGNPTSATIVSGPAHGTLGAISGTTVTYTPNPCFAVTDSFTFTLSNAFGTSTTATATITVTGPPTAADETTTTIVNTPKQIDLTVGACGSPTSAAPVGTPVGGTVSGYPATTVTFTPNKGFKDTASFQFTLANAYGTSSNVATATITVAKGLPPVAVPETASTSAGTPVTIDLSVGASGNPTKAAIVSGPVHGAISAKSGTKVIYTLTACFLGTDSFTFTLANAYGTSNVATATITITAVSTPTISVHLVDPYLLSNVQETNIDLTQLYRTQKWPTVQANGLVADNTSAAIAVVQTNDCANDVSLTTTNGTTLVNYSPDFLNTSPALGLPGLPIPVASFQNIGGSFFAAALVQAPAVGGTYSLSTPASPNPITVTAAQGSRQSLPATMSLVIPPVTLVHGIWGHRTDLQYYEDNLNTYDPWQLYPSGFGIRSIQYENDIAFDDTFNSKNGSATLQKTITGIWALLDHQGFVGGRVDVVAHSMGGLVARALAGQQNYRQWLRGRDLGETIHQIITLDTPENGTELAGFLLGVQNAVYSNQDGGEVQAVWNGACGKAQGVTVEKCFDKLGMNIVYGAVASLVPGSPSLTNKTLPGPADPKWIWNAIGAVVPQPLDINELHFLLEDLIAAIYTHTSEAQTISQILGDNGQDDAVVPFASQIQEASQAVMFKGLAHIPAPDAVVLNALIYTYRGFTAVNDSVLDSPDIATLIACWLNQNGAASCNPPPAAVTQSKAQSPLLTPKPHVLPVIAAANNEPMTVQMPRNAQLAIPFQLAIAMPGTGLAVLAVTQQDEMGHHARQEKPAISRVAGNTAYVTVIPMLLGSVTFTVEAVFKDGSVSSQDVTVPVGAPSAAPKLFRGDQFPEFSLSLQKGGDVAPLQPEAHYASITDRIDKWGHSHPVAINLEGRVDYQIVPTGAPPVVRLESDTHGSVIGVKALRPGTATIEARFGNAVDNIKVTVEQHH